ncbi:protein SKIP34 [Quillaja saponaria]|uniref:Protein SKIP34 n=1 Tax=Quillaja saponaria TaxID=32244 RepID=A0AAD7KRP7_QUISA|nr:protein SKIP34 [Quillaja saponaria]
MCCGRQQSLCRENVNTSRARRSATDNALLVEDLRGRLTDTEARLARARAREAELTRLLEEMKRFVSVMKILESYLKRQFREQQGHVARLMSTVPRI